jgi:hypothetical protein
VQPGRGCSIPRAPGLSLRTSASFFRRVSLLALPWHWGADSPPRHPQRRPCNHTRMSQAVTAATRPSLGAAAAHQQRQPPSSSSGRPAACCTRLHELGGGWAVAAPLVFDPRTRKLLSWSSPVASAQLRMGRGIQRRPPWTRVVMGVGGQPGGQPRGMPDLGCRSAVDMSRCSPSWCALRRARQLPAALATCVAEQPAPVRQPPPACLVRANRPAIRMRSASSRPRRSSSPAAARWM